MVRLERPGAVTLLDECPFKGEPPRPVDLANRSDPGPPSTRPPRRSCGPLAGGVPPGEGAGSRAVDLEFGRCDRRQRDYPLFLIGNCRYWRDGRAAFFWAALVSAPLVTASKLAPLLVAGGPESLSAVLGMIGPVAFGVATAYCFTEAFGFRRVWTVAVAIAVPVVLVVLGALLLRL